MLKPGVRAKGGHQKGGNMVVITLVAIIVFLSLLVAPVRARCKIDPAPGNGHVEIPTSWKSIEANDFQNCTSLVSLSIPLIMVDPTISDRIDLNFRSEQV